MANKRYTAEEISAKLQQVAALVARGQSVYQAVRAIGVTDVTYYKWRSDGGARKRDRLKVLEAENARLRRAVVDLAAGQQEAGKVPARRPTRGDASTAEAPGG